MAKQQIERLSKEQNKRISDQLVAIFRQEQPPADFIETVQDSVKPVDAKFRLYKGLVRTDIYCRSGVKQHVSNIRFKLDKENRVIANSITFN